MSLGYYIDMNIDIKNNYEIPDSHKRELRRRLGLIKDKKAEFYSLDEFRKKLKQKSYRV